MSKTNEAAHQMTTLSCGMGKYFAFDLPKDAVGRDDIRIVVEHSPRLADGTCRYLAWAEIGSDLGIRRRVDVGEVKVDDDDEQTIIKAIVEPMMSSKTFGGNIVRFIDYVNMAKRDCKVLLQ